MKSMNVTLPDPMKDWVRKQIEGGKYASASDYVRDLIRRDQERREAIAALDLALDEGEASGVSTRGREEILRQARARVSDEGV